jgi:hypothetical protein
MTKPSNPNNMPNPNKPRGGYRGGVKPTLLPNQRKRARTIRLDPDLSDWIDQQPEGPTQLIEEGLRLLKTKTESSFPGSQASAEPEEPSARYYNMLTEQKIIEIRDSLLLELDNLFDCIAFARAIEKEVNADTKAWLNQALDEGGDRYVP